MARSSKKTPRTSGGRVETKVMLAPRSRAVNTRSRFSSGRGPVQHEWRGVSGILVLRDAGGGSRRAALLPLDRAGWLARDVEHHAVDAAHLVDDAVRDAAEEILRELHPV